MKKTVLLIDDDPICNFISSKLLHRIDPDIAIHTVLNGKDAIALIQALISTNKPCPDVILLDLNMPVMDGFEFLNSLKEQFLPNLNNSAIIVVSSSTNPTDISRALELGVGDYLSKPLSENVLRIALQSALNKHLCDA